MDPLPILSLYRAYLRQVRALPHLYLSQFFQIRARDDVKAILSIQDQRRREIKFKSVKKRVRKIGRANNRDLKAFENILFLAYGRIGKLKWELLEPIISQPAGSLPEPIIWGVEKSRPPVYSPQLKALLTNSSSRVNKPLEPKDFIHPRTLPPRANPLSEEARLFGPFSKRREVNIRWRFYRNELKKILPPLEAIMDEDTTLDKNLLRPPGMQGSDVMHDLERIVGDELHLRPPQTRREKRSISGSEERSPGRPERHPSRWLRRRYRALLSTIPQLSYQLSPKGGSKILINKHPLSHHPHDRDNRSMPNADPIHVAWIEHSEPEHIQQNTEKKIEGKDDYFVPSDLSISSSCKAITYIL